jgi:hypothetical protein
LPKEEKVRGRGPQGKWESATCLRNLEKIQKMTPELFITKTDFKRNPDSALKSDNKS